MNEITVCLRRKMGKCDIELAGLLKVCDVVDVVRCRSILCRQMDTWNKSTVVYPTASCNLLIEYCFFNSISDIKVNSIGLLITHGIFVR